MSMARRIPPLVLLAVIGSVSAAAPQRVHTTARGCTVLKRVGRPDTLVAAKLKVHVIPTSYGAGAGGHRKYPKTISLQVPASLIVSVSAYGAADRIWLAPKGWAGRAAQGADGSTAVEFRPHFGRLRARPHVIYRDDGGCAGCAVVDAARYFPEVRGEVRDLYGRHEKTPVGLKTQRVSSRLVTFDLPGTTGNVSHGVAFYSGDSDYYFAQVTVVLPRSDFTLGRFLRQYFAAGFACIEHRRIR